MSNYNQKKYTLSTDTDLHFDMLADHSKLKIMPNLTKNKPEISMNDNDNSDISDDEMIDDINSDSLKFHQSSEEEDNKESHYNKEEYNKQKMIHDYKNKIVKEQNHKKISTFDKITENDDDDDDDDDETGNEYRRSTEIRSPNNTPEKKKTTPTLTELYGMDEVPYHMLDKQTQKFKKMEKYAELLAIKNIGIKLTKEYDLHSDYEDMCFEVQYWTNHQKKNDAVNLGKGFMMNAVTALEFMNDRYDPFGLKLKGWSDQMQIGMDGYNNVFGELYDKYKSTGRKMEPEIKLVLMLSASAVSFHASKKMAEQLPGLDKVFESNPELLSKLQGVINNGISKSGNIEQPSNQETQRKMYDQMQQLKQQQAKFDELKKQQDKIESNTDRLKEQMKKTSSQNNNPKDNNPKDINSILNRIRAQNAVEDADKLLNDTSDDSERISVESTLAKEELINDSSNDSAKGETLTLGSDGKPKRRKRRGKPTISITTN